MKGKRKGRAEVEGGIWPTQIFGVHPIWDVGVICTRNVRCRTIQRVIGNFHEWVRTIMSNSLQVPGTRAYIGKVHWTKQTRSVANNCSLRFTVTQDVKQSLQLVTLLSSIRPRSVTSCIPRGVTTVACTIILEDGNLGRYKVQCIPTGHVDVTTFPRLTPTSSPFMGSTVQRRIQKSENGASFQVYIFKSVQILAYQFFVLFCFTLQISTFFISRGGAGTSPRYSRKLNSVAQLSLMAARFVGNLSKTNKIKITISEATDPGSPLPKFSLLYRIAS